MAVAVCFRVASTPSISCCLLVILNYDMRTHGGISVSAEEQVSQLGEVQSRADLVDGSFVVAMTLCSIGVDKIFCQKGITNTDLVRSLGAHGICIMSYASPGSAQSAASSAVHDGTGCPSFILSNIGHLWTLQIIVPPVSTRNLFVFMPIGLEREAISIYVIPSSLFRLLHEATSSGTQLYLSIFSDALQQTVSMLEANYLISFAWKSAKHEALLQERRGFPRSMLVHPFQPYPVLPIWRAYNPSRFQTANPTSSGGDDGELQLLSTAADFATLGEVEAYSPREYWAYSAQQKLLIAGSEGASTSQTAPFDHSHQRHQEHLVNISGQDILIATVQTDHSIRQVGSSAPTIVKCLHNGWLWVQRRIKREVSYPAQIERVLYNGDVFWKYGISMAGLALTVEELGNVKGLDALKPSVPCLYILMLGSLVFMNVGQSLKTTFPEGSVFAMLLSKAMTFASFFILSLGLLPLGGPWRGTIHLMIALLSFTILSTVGYSIWKDDIRESEEIEKDSIV